MSFSIMCGDNTDHMKNKKYLEKKWRNFLEQSKEGKQQQHEREPASCCREAVFSRYVHVGTLTDIW